MKNRISSGVPGQQTNLSHSKQHYPPPPSTGEELNVSVGSDDGAYGAECLCL